MGRARRSALTGGVGLVVSLGTAGCLSLGGSRSETTQPRAIASAQVTHEYPSPSPPRETTIGGAPSAVQALRAFATAYINWDADTVASRMHALAAESVGQARSATELLAAQTASDYELRRGGIANRGSVEAIAPLFGHRNQYAVVTRELTSATNTTAYEGLRPAWHLALATVVELHGRWVVSAWQPES